MAFNVTATPDPAVAGVLLTVAEAPAGSPFTITRSDVNGANLVRLRQGQVPIAGSLIVTDYEPALTGTVTYTVAVGATRTSTSTSLAGLVDSRPRIVSAQVPSVATTSPVVTGYSGTRESSSTVHEVIERADPVVVLGPQRLRRGTLTLRHFTHADAVNDALTLGRVGVGMLRQADHAGLDMYFVPGRIATEPADLAASGWHWETRCDYVEVRSPALPLLGQVGWSYSGLVASVSSYAALLTEFDDYADLVVG